MSSVRVALVADDHGMVRLGLALTLKDRLGFSEVIEAGSLDAALAVLGERDDIALALFDLSMPGMAGAASLSAVRETHPGLRLAVVSGNEDRSVVLEALRAGVHGYISKQLPDERLIRALQTILDGERYIPETVLTEGVLDVQTTLPAAPILAQRLTPRQCEVLRLLVAGKANKEIARALTLGEGTVKIHMAALFRTLRVQNRAGAVAAGLPLVPHLKE